MENMLRENVKCSKIVTRVFPGSSDQNMGTGGGKIIQKKRNTATIQILSLPSAFNDLFIDVRKMFTAKKKNVFL